MFHRQITIIILFLCVTLCLTVSATFVRRYASSTEARCLDGSRAVHFISRATDPAHARDWVIFLEGGGWCTSLDSCVSRTLTPNGSSRPYANVTFVPKHDFEWYFTRDPRHNPIMHGWNFLDMTYCDGSSFTSHLAAPIVHRNVSLWFRGRHILYDTLSEMRSTYGAFNNLVLLGRSAGGLSVLLHADRINRLFRPSRIRAVPISGFFMEPDPLYLRSAAHDFRWLYQTVGSAVMVSPRCPLSADQRWRCLWPPNFAQYVNVPTFVVQSRYDNYQVEHLLQVNLFPTELRPTLIAGFARNMSDAIICTLLRANPLWHGMFLHSSYTHNMEIDPKYHIHDTTFRDIFSRWFLSPASEPNLYTYDVPFPCPEPCFGKS